MLVQSAHPTARRAVRLVFSGERVRSDYLEPAPVIGPCRILNGLRLIPVADLVRMKLTSYRASDEAHIIDLDHAGLITADIESTLSPQLKERLTQARARR